METKLKKGRTFAIIKENIERSLLCLVKVLEIKLSYNSFLLF